MNKFPSMEILFPKKLADCKKKADTLRELCIRQGYVPNECTLAGVFIYAFVAGSEDPCAGCQENRRVCGGRTTDPDYLDNGGAE